MAAVINPKGGPLNAPGAEHHKDYARLTLLELDDVRRKHFHRR